MMNVKDPLKNIQLKTGLRTENNRVTDSIKGPNGYKAKSFTNKAG
jgi:hypothetical protein